MSKDALLTELVGSPYTERKLLCICGGWLHIYEQDVYPERFPLFANRYVYKIETRLWFWHPEPFGEFCAEYRTAVRTIVEKELRNNQMIAMNSFEFNFSQHKHG